MEGGAAKITAEVSDAAAHGDRSENAEYIYGKKKLYQIDRRLRFLSKRLDELEVVRPEPAQQGKVCFGASVTTEDEEGAEACYRIVGPDEYDPKQGKISVDSPMARALLGKREGDVTRVRGPRGDNEVEVVKIEYDLGK